jgi:hypothetical protein
MSTQPTREVTVMPAPVLRGPDGREVRLSDLPLVAYALGCGCVGRDYAVQKGDILFCAEHAENKKVTTILAS